ncbi:MAG: hypothetical protein KF718_13870 [Polyangiaceae bacterium]|nr:hypothetical protein [Polyangiaceae bacterium]
MVRDRPLAHLVLLLAASCQKPSTDDAPAHAPSAAPSAATAAASVRPPRNAPLPGERVDIPAGAFRAGSLPGQPGRDPEREPVELEVELGQFQIDRLPFPGDPSAPPKTGVTREQASRLCAERGARLCTELEWERACRGPGNDTYLTGTEWEPRCAEKPSACASGFDVLGMGAGLREWTASDLIPESGPRRASIRGAKEATSPTEYRCAARRGVDPETAQDDIGFRCCGGAPNAAVVKEPRLGQTFQRAKLSAAQLEQLLGRFEQTRAIAKDIKYFREPEAAATVVARGPGDKKGFLFTVAPLTWNPVAGSEYLIVSARSGENTSFVVVFHVAGDDHWLAASFIMRGEPGPVALAYSGYIRPRLHFSSCWGCPGETGKILHRHPDSVVIVQP